MPTAPFSPDWTKRYSTDPYAVLGVAVTADERRILKRYRQVAKQLHPDIQATQAEDGREFANQVLARLVNPAYQRLKQDKGRAETLATLRFKVRRLSREQKLSAQGDLAQQLRDSPEPEVDVFYEQALSTLSEAQYSSFEAFTQQTAAIAELNLIYLRRKMGDPVIREKRTGLVSSATVQSSVTVNDDTLSGQPVSAPPPNYAQRHIDRAKTYIANKKYMQAIQEFRDAVRIEPNNSDYHTMLGQSYLMNKMGGMAKVHIRQALKLNPHNTVALKYAKHLSIELTDLNASSSKPKKSGGLFGRFARKN
ncbi:MAG: DnaJ domain-containing protein [Cyanobacteria bacterium]|nr:DnaJ domain-containing protein [Cyanobacteriota bacterium]